MKNVVYLLVDTSPFALPIDLFETLQSASEKLNVSRETLKKAIYRHGVYKADKYHLIRVALPAHVTMSANKK